MKLSAQRFIEETFTRAENSGEPVSTHATKLPWSLGTIRTIISRMVREGKLKPGCITRYEKSSDRLEFIYEPVEDLITDQHQVELNSQSKWESLVVSNPNEKVLAALLVLIENELIMTVTLPGWTEREFTIQFPELSEHFNLRTTQEGIILI